MLEPGNNDELPPIPGKRYFTIGEVSDLCAVKPHVLRYWEQEFPQLKPVKRRGNRRYYQRQDVLIIRQIRSLLYEEGFTIGGARQRLTGDEAKSDVSQSQHVMAESLFNELGLNKREARELVDMYFEELRASLAVGEQVKLSGFGNFDLRDKKERPGRNPKTGQEIPISARRVVTFRPGQKLKARVEAYAGTGE